MKTALIAYHANCLDGFTAAWVAHTALKKKGYEVDLLPMGYNEKSLGSLIDKVNVSKRYEELYIVDYSVPIAFLEQLETNYSFKVTILDHHKTAFETYFPDHTVTPDSVCKGTIHDAEIILANMYSGAGLCWLHFNTGVTIDQMPKLVAYVQDYDLWRFEFGLDTKYVNKYISQFQKDASLTAWSKIAEEMEFAVSLRKILDEGKVLYTNFMDRVDGYVSAAASCILEGHIGLIVEAPYQYASEIGGKLAEISGTFGATFVKHPDRKVIQYSLRSRSDFDVSAIAKANGGGGHKNAAGFECPYTIIDQLDAIAIDEA